MIGLDLASGAVQWRYQPGAGAKGPAHPDPFAAAEGPDDASRARGDVLHGFRLVKFINVVLHLK